MSKIDLQNTKAILIGVSEFQDKSFINASPIRNNVIRLNELFQDKDILGIDEKNILLLNKNERHDEILDKIETFIDRDFTDTLFFYFAGHGYKSDKGDFYLITNNTNKKHLTVSSIPWESIKEILEKGSGIQQRLYILDACHSGVAELGENDEVMDIDDGSALIAAARADSKAYFNPSDQYTYFTNAFIDILENGIQNFDEPELALKPIFDQLDKNLQEKKIGITIKMTHKIDLVTWFKNRSFDKLALILKQARTHFDEGNYEEALSSYKYAISELVLYGQIEENKLDEIKKEIENVRIHQRIQEKVIRDLDKNTEKEKVQQEADIKIPDKKMKEQRGAVLEFQNKIDGLRPVPKSIKKAVILLYISIGIGVILTIVFQFLGVIFYL